jgi:MFS family permease
MISSAIFEIPTGIYSDIIGRKKTIMMGALSATLSAILYAAGYSYWPLFLGALLEGLSRSWYSGNNDALLYESVGDKTFAHYFGKTNSMFQLALMFGAVIGSVLAQWSFSLIMWLSVLPQLMCLGISLFLINPENITKGKTNVFSHIKTSAFHLWKNKQLKLLTLQDIFQFGFGEPAFQFNSAFIATIWPIWAIGFSKMLSYGTAFISYWFSGKIIKKIGEYNTLIYANIFSRILNSVAYAIPTIISPVLTGVTGIWYGANEVSKNTLMQQEYTKEQRATLSSLSSFFGNIFYGLFAPILGLFADSFGPAKAMVMIQFCMLSVLVINIKLKYEHSRH